MVLDSGRRLRKSYWKRLKQSKTPTNQPEISSFSDKNTFWENVIEWFVTDPSQLTVKDAENKKNYHFFKSNYIFLFGGRLKFVKGIPLNFLVGFLIILPFGLFLGFEAKSAWKVSPAIIITFAYIWLICFTSFIKASISDPGIVPRNLHLTDNPFNLPNEYFNTITLPGPVEKSSLSVDVKYCLTCHDWRLPRSSHCSICNSCILIHDHHCRWLNNCVGLRNYKHFFNFLLSAILLCIYLLTISFVLIHRRSQDSKVTFLKSIKEYPIDLFLIIYSILSFIYPFLLLCFHMFLNLNNYTTREYLNYVKGHDNSYRNSYKLNGTWKNLVYAWFKPIGVPLIGIRDTYELGDRRFDYIPKGRNFNIES